MRPLLSPRSAGFTAVEVVVAMGISVMMVAGILVSFLSLDKSSQDSIEVISRENLFKSVVAALQNEKALLKTVLKNDSMKKCVTVIGLTPPVGKICGDEVPQGIEFYDSSDIQIAGTPDNPVLYDSWGARCEDPDDKRCVFRVWTEFRAICLPQIGSVENSIPMSKCSAGLVEMIELRLTVDPVRKRDGIHGRPLSMIVTYDMRDTALRL